jgi:DNA polymerase III delta subunit
MSSSATSISLLYGEDEYRLMKAVRAMRAQWVQPGLEAFSHQKLEKPSLSQVVEAYRATRLGLGGDVLLEVRHCAALMRKESDDQALEMLMKLMAEPPVGIQLLWVSEKVDKKLKLSKWLTGSKMGHVQTKEFAVLPFYKTEEAAQLLVQEAASQGIQLQAKAALLLVESFGTALGPLMMEVEKASLLSDTGKTLGEAQVQALCRLQKSWFDVLDHWLLGYDKAHLYQQLSTFLQGESPQSLFVRCRAHVQWVLKLRLLRFQGETHEAIGKALGKNPYFVKVTEQKLTPVSIQRLWHLHHQLLSLESGFKSGQVPDAVALDLLMTA